MMKVWSYRHGQFVEVLAVDHDLQTYVVRVLTTKGHRDTILKMDDASTAYTL